jgi:hypothetical protein
MSDPYAPSTLTPPPSARAAAAPPSGGSPPVWHDPTTLAAVRPEVRRVLEASPGFAKLSPEEQQRLAQAMVKVSAYMANPDGLAAEELSDRGGVLARAQADVAKDAGKKATSDKGFAGADFEGGAIKQGTEQFGELVQKVDFPAFVSGLIQNVFQAIVDASVQQMQAYGELIANVAKTVDQFAKDNITENNARDWMSQRWPGQVEVGVEQAGFGFAEGFGDEAAAPQPRVQVTAEDPSAFLQQVSQELGLAKPVTDLSDPNEELRLVQAARLQIARSRQQMLASMVMLGINRIVVTDGLIHAKVVFGMRASDVAQRADKASAYDRQRTSSQARVSASYGGWFSPVKASASASTSSDHVTTVASSVDETSESKAEVKAQLSGEVRVNFKSDYLPMEKMATPQMIAAIQGNAQPVEPPAQQAAAGT